MHQVVGTVQAGERLGRSRPVEVPHDKRQGDYQLWEEHDSLEELRPENMQQGGENYNLGIALVEEDRTALEEEEHRIVPGEVGRRTGHEVLGILPAEDHHIGVVDLRGQRIVALEDQVRSMLAQGGHMTHSGYTEGWGIASRVHHIGQTAGVSHNHSSAVAGGLVSAVTICR